MSEESVKPWERQPYESQAAWTYFQLYLEQTPPRSLLSAYRKWRSRNGQNPARLVKNVPGSWRDFAAGRRRDGSLIPSAISWAKRASAWDDLLAKIKRKEWMERQRLLIEKEWELGQKLIEKAEQMLMFPVVAQDSVDGKVIIMPGGWRFRDILAVVTTASKLARLATGMSTENIGVDWRKEANNAGVDPDAIFRELVNNFEQHLKGELPKE